MSWIDEYRSLFSWGDLIRCYPKHPLGCDLAFTDFGVIQWYLEATNNSYLKALQRAHLLEENHRVTTTDGITLVFSDSDLEPADTERLIWSVGRHGFGTDFICPMGRVVRNRLANNFTEGEIIELAKKIIYS